MTPAALRALFVLRKSCPSHLELVLSITADSRNRLKKEITQLHARAFRVMVLWPSGSHFMSVILLLLRLIPVLCYTQPSAPLTEQNDAFESETTDIVSVLVRFQLLQDFTNWSLCFCYWFFPVWECWGKMVGLKKCSLRNWSKIVYMYNMVHLLGKVPYSIKHLFAELCPIVSQMLNMDPEIIIIIQIKKFSAMTHRGDGQSLNRNQCMSRELKVNKTAKFRQTAFHVCI